MATKYIEIVNGTTDARCPADRTNAKAAGIYSDSSDSYQLKYLKNGTLKKQADEDNVGSLINGASNTASGAYKTAKVALNGTTIHGGVQAWQNPEAGSIVVTEVVVVVSTVATAAGDLDVGTTATGATTASDNLIDGVDVHSATGAFDNNTDKGSNGKTRQRLAAGKWVTFSDDGVGDVSGMVAAAYISYVIE